MARKTDTSREVKVPLDFISVAGLLALDVDAETRAEIAFHIAGLPVDDRHAFLKALA